MKGKPLVWTICWVVAMAAWGLFAHWRPVTLTIPYPTYEFWRFFLGIPFSAAALYCVWFFQQGNIVTGNSPKTLNDEAVAWLVFWVIFPPIWFFAEYYVIDCGFLVAVAQDPKLATQLALRENAKIYGDYASKIWAAFLFLYGASIAQRLK